MKKNLLIIMLLAFALFANAYSYTTVNKVLQIGEKYTISWSTSSSGYGCNVEQLGTGMVAYSTASLSRQITALQRGQGIAYTWAGSTFKYYVLKVVDVINIEIPDNVSITVGDSYTYTPIITDTEATTTLTWTSSNPAVATVNASGVVTAVASGQAKIICKAANGISAQSLVNISPRPVQSVTLNNTEYEMEIGNSVNLTASVLPANATFKTVKWMSSNENIAQVDDEGNVTAIASGYCSIYAIADDSSRKYDKCLIHVQGKPAQKADVNGDGEVSVTDAFTVIDFILNNNNQ